MPGVQCNWHLGDLDRLSEEAAVEQIRELKATANIMDLNKDEQELSGELQSLLVKEGQYAERSHGLDGRSLECGIKWSPDHVLLGGTKLSCFHCPMFNATREDPASLICSLGRRQEEIGGQLAAIRGCTSLDDEMCAAYERDLDALGPDLDARLTYVG